MSDSQTTVPPYRVEMDDSHLCGCCGRGAMWDVIGPDDVALGRSFGDKEEAEDYARDLSLAYGAGRAYASVSN